jgi:hypothetical protein
MRNWLLELYDYWDDYRNLLFSHIYVEVGDTYISKAKMAIYI